MAVTMMARAGHRLAARRDLMAMPMMGAARDLGRRDLRGVAVVMVAPARLGGRRGGDVMVVVVTHVRVGRRRARRVVVVMVMHVRMGHASGEADDNAKRGDRREAHGVGHSFESPTQRSPPVRGV